LCGANCKLESTQAHVAAAKASGGELKMGGTRTKQEDQIITALIEKSQGAKLIKVPTAEVASRVLCVFLTVNDTATPKKITDKA
jgi:tripartite-type tricarboxylate transporter receptor subunit TctC